jgi:hypothetical protein
MTTPMIKTFLVTWALQLNRPTLLEAFTELVDLHEGLLDAPAYWPQLLELIRDMATEL